MKNITAVAKIAARASKGLNIEEGLNSEYVAIWSDGSVSTVDCATEARGSGDGWEYPALCICTPHTVAMVRERLQERAA
jgi:hypothetical protein